MLGSIVVAIVTASLLFVGVYLGTSENQDNVAPDSANESYNEGFFRSIDSLMGGLQEAAERGEEVKEDRYQSYLRTQQVLEETTPSSPVAPTKTYQIQPTVTSKTEPVKIVPSTTDVNPQTPTSVSDLEDDLNLDILDDDSLLWEFGDLEDLSF